MSHNEFNEILNQAPTPGGFNMQSTTVGTSTMKTQTMDTITPTDPSHISTQVPVINLGPTTTTATTTTSTTTTSTTSTSTTTSKTTSTTKSTTSTTTTTSTSSARTVFSTSLLMADQTPSIDSSSSVAVPLHFKSYTLNININNRFVTSEVIIEVENPASYEQIYNFAIDLGRFCAYTNTNLIG